MAEDLPSSCTYYLDGGLNRKNLPPLLVDQRLQPLTETEPDEERNKWELEQQQLQDDVGKNDMHLADKPHHMYLSDNGSGNAQAECIHL